MPRRVRNSAPEGLEPPVGAKQEKTHENLRKKNPNVVKYTRFHFSVSFGRYDGNKDIPRC